jgi:hypothetical protein
MADHPMKVLLRTAAWHQLVRTVCWIRDHTAEAVYLREIDVPGVDTKFIETNKAILAELLDHTLPEDRIDASAPKSDLAARYGLRTRKVVPKTVPDGELIRRLHVLSWPERTGRHRHLWDSAARFFGIGSDLSAGK